MDRGRSAKSTYAGLTGKTVFVTGGGSEIGAAFTQAFAGQGARVAFVDVAEQSSRTLAAQIQKETSKAPLFIACDLRNSAALQEDMERARIERVASRVLIIH